MLYHDALVDCRHDVLYPTLRWPSIVPMLIHADLIRPRESIHSAIFIRVLPAVDLVASLVHVLDV